VKSIGLFERAIVEVNGEMTDENAMPDRRVDLDRVRIIEFGLLILYHVGMLFVPWNFHVKSAQPSRRLLGTPFGVATRARIISTESTTRLSEV
jgi:hypothetical protein